ncbi:MAG: MaoC/PaaZ C-terminal domain-containing protein [Polyangiales bacterium]
MSFDLSLVGNKSEPTAFEYDWKQIVLYALGIGAKEDELDYLYEGRGPKTYPSFAVVPTFAPMLSLLGRTGGNLAAVVHGGQKVKMHAPLPAEGKLLTTATIRGIYDMKKFASVITDTETTDAKGNKLFDTTWSIIFRGGGGFGGNPPPKEDVAAPPTDGTRADFSIAEATTKEQALLYRLSGDLNPLHADPAFAQMAGFPQGPILHGLCTFGYMVRHVVKGACGGDATKLRAFEAQFRKPVWPGDTIVTSGWKLADGRYALTVGVNERPDPVITNAVAVVD